MACWTRNASRRANSLWLRDDQVFWLFDTVFAWTSYDRISGLSVTLQAIWLHLFIPWLKMELGSEGIWEGSGREGRLGWKCGWRRGGWEWMKRWNGRGECWIEEKSVELKRNGGWKRRCWVDEESGGWRGEWRVEGGGWREVSRE